jgi:uncharacterized protein with HEPN domain
MNRDQQSIIDIIDSINLIFEYMQDRDWQDFEVNIKIQDAVFRRLTIIGEAVKRLSLEFRTQHPHIPWRSMAGLRDVVVHEYDDLDFRTVRDIVEKELPTVLEDLLPLLPPENL